MGEQALLCAAVHELEPHLREPVRADERILGTEAFVYGVLAAVRADLAIRRVIQLGLSLAETARQRALSTSGIAKAVARVERRLVQ